MKKADVQKAITELDGNISAVARRFKVSRGAIYKFIYEKYPDLMDSVHEARETIIDDVESELYKQAKKGNTTAMIFFLKTQGQSRGYVEKTQSEISTKDDKPIKIIEVIRSQGADE